MVFLSRKQLLITGAIAMISELVITIALVAIEYLGWLNQTTERLILWVLFSAIALMQGWLSRKWTGNWFVALLIPLLVFSTFIVVSMNNPVYLAYVPLYVAVSVGGFYLFALRASKKR